MKASKKIIIFAFVIVVALLICLAIFNGKIFGSNKLLISGQDATKKSEDIVKSAEIGDNEPRIDNTTLSEEDVKNESAGDISPAGSNAVTPNENNDTGGEINRQKIEELEKKETEKTSIVNHLINWGYSSSVSRKIDVIVIHSSYNALGGDAYNFEKLLAEYKEYGVSAHYVIDREGKIYRLVSEKNIAYHAGESEVPDGRTGVNDFSIGIELMNKEDSKFTSEQYNSLNYLISAIKGRYKIKYVLGHNQIAPGRKTDPWNLDWDRING